MLGHVHVGFGIADDVSALDTRALADPGIAGIHALREIEVRDNLRRQITAGTDNPRVHACVSLTAATRYSWLSGSVCFSITRLPR